MSNRDVGVESIITECENDIKIIKSFVFEPFDTWNYC